MKRWLRRIGIGFGLLLLLILGLWIAGPEPVLMGPYVQNVGVDHAEICCYAEQPFAMKVELSGKGATRSFDGKQPPVSALRVRVTGLEPATRYQYRILAAADERELFAGSFMTAPAKQDAGFKMALVGDSGDVPNWFKLHKMGVGRLRGLVQHLETTGQWGVAASMAKQAPELFFHLGDIIYTHNQIPGYEEAFFRPFAPVLEQAVLFTTHGNHDMHEWEHPEYFKVFHRPAPLDPARGYRDSSYSFVWGGLRFLVLDAFWAGWEEGSQERAWLREQLQLETPRRTVVLVHNPPFSDERGVTENAKVQQNIWPELVRAKVSLVISGDSHSYQRFKPIDGIPLVIVGTGGKSIRPVDSKRLAHKEERFGFLLLDVDGKKIRGEFWADGAEPLDRFEY